MVNEVKMKKGDKIEEDDLLMAIGLQIDHPGCANCDGAKRGSYEFRIE
jgi:hypothetical protein